MQNKIVKNAKLFITVAIIIAFVWFLVVSPMITFHSNEKKLEEAARRYYELNSRELPTGERIKTLTLNTLYHKSFLKDNLNIPYSNKTCSITNSWVKVKKVNNEYKYYTYLECGILSSSIDHQGPNITLNGENSVTVGIGEKYQDAGVKSVVDNVDGKMKIEDVTVKGTVDTSKIGTYEIKYIAFDSLNNKTEVIREIKVVKKIYSTVKKDLNNTSNYTGDPSNNYIRLSNMLFRVYGVDKDKNVIIVSDEDIANVNYSKLDSWLDYYYNNLNDTTKKMIVKKKYCNMKVNETALDTTECRGYTKERLVFIPSIIEVNKAKTDSINFMRPNTISWVANMKNDSTAYVTRNMFFYEEEGKTYLSYNIKDNYGVRPMMTIKGSTLITGGTGSKEDPYVFGDVKRASGGSRVNERFTGEYVSLDGEIYRIINVDKDGTTRVISNFTVGSIFDYIGTTANPGSDKIEYNPKNKLSAAYYINNRVGEYINTSYFTKHKIQVPIYKNKIIYGEEVETKEYEVMLSAPNMYEMFSAKPQNSDTRSYWLVNSSKGKRIAGALYDIGVPMNEEIDNYMKLSVRVVGYLKSNSIISSGDGTLESPYIVR